MALVNAGVSNTIEIGSNISVEGKIEGDNNSVVIGDSIKASTLRIRISGDNNKIHIGKSLYIRGLTIRCGNNVKAHNTEIVIAENVSIEQGGRFYLYNSGNKCAIGKNCLFSNSLIIRCGESPHLIFDKDTGEYLDVSDGVFVGDHVWIGEKVYITKRTTIPSESVVAACSVVTRRFDTPHSVIAGNPARVVRENVQWIRNRGHLEPGNIYQKSYNDHNAQFQKK